MFPRLFRILPVTLLLVGVAACSDDDPMVVRTTADINGYVTLDGQEVADAPVYLARVPGFMPSAAPFVTDSTRTDDDGLFEFDELDPWVFMVYSEVIDDGKATWLVSPFSDAIELGDVYLPDKGASAKGAGMIADLALREVDFEGVVSGDVWLQSEVATAVDSAEVRLLRYTSGDLEMTHETLSNATGHYAMAGVATGNYTVYAMKVYDVAAPFPVYNSGETEPFFCDGTGHVVVPTLWLYEAMVEKPAIYIYPVEPGTFSVTLDLANGTRLATTEPEYGEGWEVDVAADGRIDDAWDYLFYEVAVSAWPMLEQGWCFPREDLAAGLSDIVAAFGLNEAEREDFLEYWTHRLPRHDWYVVKPVVGDHLDTWVGLDVVPEPDSVIRFWLFFEGASEPVGIVPPAMPRVARTGTTVVEWGGAVVPASTGF